MSHSFIRPIKKLKKKALKNKTKILVITKEVKDVKAHNQDANN